MKFKNLLDEYEYLRDIAKVQKERPASPKTKEYWDGYLAGIFRLFTELKMESDFNPSVDEPTKEEKQKYYLEKYQEYPSGILRYRGQEAPIYFDDYGQQEYMVFQNKEYNGGAYNNDCRWYFCQVIDDILDFGK